MQLIRNVLTLLWRERYVYLSLFVLGVFVAVYIPSFAATNLPDGPDIEGHDFMSFHAAGRLALAGTPEKAWDRAAHDAMQKQVAREAKGGDGFADSYHFAYPPTYLTVVTPFAALPYFASFYAFMAVTGAIYLWAIWRILPDPRSLLLAVAFPGALCAFVFGQNAFLTAGLMGLALLNLERRPLVAGLLIGLLCFKPQLGLAFPIVLAASGRWRAFAAAAVGVVLSVALSVALFGVGAWEAMLGASGANRDVLLENSAVGFGKIESFFAALRYFGVPVVQAYAAQAVFSLVVATLLVRLWRSGADYELKAAGCLAGTLLITPFVLPYDLVAEAPAIAFLVAHARRRGFFRGETLFLGLIATTPAISTLAFEGPAFLTGIGGLILLFGWVLVRARPLDAPDAVARPAGA